MPLVNFANTALLTTYSRILVAAVFTVGVSIALPRVVYATTVGLALELEFSALERALSLVALVTAVVDSVADRHARRTISVRALEHARSTVPRRTARRLVGTVFAILLSVASVVQFLS